MDIQVHGCAVDAAEYPPHPTAIYNEPKDYCFFNVYRNALQGVSALCALPDVDPNRICVVGGSQGGRVSVVVAGLDERIRAAVPAITHYAYIPWLSWTERLNRRKQTGQAGFRAVDVVHDAKCRVESYFDVLNFAPQIRCPVLMNAGLIDPVSPVTGVFAVYRSVTSTKEMVPMPNLAHDWSPAFDRYAWAWLERVLNKPKNGRDDI
jgi:cephalosporin-C deacetylase